jgi:hypothetical protein
VGISYNAWVTLGHIYGETGGGFSANHAGQAVFDYFPDTAQVNDALYFGHNPRFDDLRVWVGPPFAAASVTFAWEYWNGSVWAALSVADGTNGWTATGQRTIGFTPPDDWRESVVNGVTMMWVRCRITAVTGLTEGGANAAEMVQVGDNLLVVTGFSESAPCTFEALHNASVSGAWGVVLRQGLDQYLLRARLQVGDGSTPTWLVDERRQVEFAYIGVSWSGVISLYATTNGVARFGRVLEASQKIGGHGCGFQLGSVSSNYFRTFGGSLEFYGCTFSSRGGDARIVHSANVKLWNCLFHGWQVGASNLSAGEIYHVTLLDGASLDEVQPSTAMDDIVAFCASGNVFTTYFGGITVTNLRVLGSPDYLLFPFYDGSPITLIDCQSPVWRIGWNQCRQPVYRKYTLNLRVSDAADNPLSGAWVDIRDAWGNPAPGSPFLTDEEGRIPAQVLDYAVYTYEAGLADDTRVAAYSPYALTISKAGYAEYRDAVEVDRPHMDLEAALNPPPPPVYVPGPASELAVDISRPTALMVAMDSQKIEVELYGE